MSESDTFLDSILKGVTVAEAPPSDPEQLLSPENPPAQAYLLPQVPAPAPARATQVTEAPLPSDPSVAGLDAARDDLPPLFANIPPTSVPGPRRDVTDDPGSDPESVAPRVALPVVAPHEILGLSGHTDSGASNMALALEVNDVSGSAPSTVLPTTAPVAAAEPTTAAAPTASFAAIAREIAATVEASAPTRAGKDQSDSDRSSVYLRTQKRRRRRLRRGAWATFAPAFGIILLLVVGLAGEYEFVARGHSTSSSSPAPNVPALASTLPPKVVLSPVKGSLFHFATFGSAESAPFRVASRFRLVVTAKCSPVTASSSVDVVLRSQGRQAANIFVAAKAPGIHEVSSAILPAGIYVLITHAPGTCSWSAQAFKRT